MHIVHTPILPFANFVASRINMYGKFPIEEMLRRMANPIGVGDGEFVNWNDVCYGDQMFDTEAEAEAEEIGGAHLAYRMAEWFGPTPTEGYCEYLYNTVVNLEARFLARCEATADVLDAWRKPYADVVNTIRNLREIEVDRPCEIQRAERRMEFANDSRMAGVPIDWDTFSRL